jgi:predicted DNA-binding transcriptional regulator AlpA
MRPEMNRRPTGRTITQPRRGLDHDEAAIYVGVTFTTFDQMVTDGRLPRPAELNGELVWDLVQLDKAMDRLTGLRRPTTL